MQQRSSKMKRGAQHARLVAGALVRSFSTRGGALAVVFATLLSLGFATLAAAAGAPTKAGASRPPANIRPPQITGQAQVGQILRAEPGKWRAGRWKPSKLSFQWRLCGSAGLSCADVVQAKDGIYAVRPADADHALRVIVRATNAAGTTSASSRQTEPVAPALRDAPVATARPLIVGKAIAGTVLTAEAGGGTGE